MAGDGLDSGAESMIGPPTRFDPAIYAVLVCILAVMLALLPSTFLSLSRTLFGRADAFYRFPGGELADLEDASLLPEQVSIFNIAVTELNETDHSVTLAVSGRGACPGTCGGELSMSLISYDVSSGVLRGLGQQVTVIAPISGKPFSVTEALPVEGWPGVYPFDRYRLRLGIEAYWTSAGKRIPESPNQAALANITVQNATYDLTLNQPRPVPLAVIDDASDDLRPMGAMDLVFQRPLHLRVLSIALFTMMAVSTVLGLFSRSLPAVVFGNAGLLLGIYSIRSVLVPYSITVTTAVDVACQLLILLMLVGVTIRIAAIIRQRSELPLMPGAPRRRG